tara:strand:+ start:7673 stop:8041 length:369 start_codon:yes stop_codon:yes gene_type:complete
MAVETTTVSNPLIKTMVTDTDSDITVETAAGAAQFLYFVEVYNPNTTATYTKLIAAASGSNAQTQHYIQLYCPADTTCYFYVPTSVGIGTGLQFYSSTLPGAVNSQISPTNDVTVKIGLTAQ